MQQRLIDSVEIVQKAKNRKKKIKINSLHMKDGLSLHNIDSKNIFAYYIQQTNDAQSMKNCHVDSMC